MDVMPKEFISPIYDILSFNIKQLFFQLFNVIMLEQALQT